MHINAKWGQLLIHVVIDNLLEALKGDVNGIRAILAEKTSKAAQLEEEVSELHTRKTEAEKTDKALKSKLSGILFMTYSILFSD